MKWHAALFLPILLSPLHAAPESGKDIQKRIQKITFPSIELKDVSLAEALDHLQRRSKELDGDPDPAMRGVTFTLMPGAGDAGAPERIRFSGTGVTLESALRQIAASANRDVYITSTGIVICPAGGQPFPNQDSYSGDIIEKL